MAHSVLFYARRLHAASRQRALPPVPPKRAGATTGESLQKGNLARADLARACFSLSTHGPAGGVQRPVGGRASYRRTSSSRSEYDGYSSRAMLPVRLSISARSPKKGAHPVKKAKYPRLMMGFDRASLCERELEAFSHLANARVSLLTSVSGGMTEE